MAELVLVTGGAGFVGSHVVDELVELGIDVRVLDSLHQAAHATTPAYTNPTAQYVWGDLRDPDTVKRAVDGVTHVTHQASMVGLGTRITDITDYVAHNDYGTATLLRVLAEQRFRGRLVLASSMVVYGEGSYVCRGHGLVYPRPRTAAALGAGEFDPPCPACESPLEPRAIAEDARVDPRNVYAATKLHQEHLCQCFAREREGVDLTALRYHNVYGPRMPHDTPYAGVASVFRSALCNGRRARVFEDGRQLRDFVHVRDVAHANVLVLTRPAAAPGTFNIASGTPRSVLDMAQALTEAAGPAAAPPEITGEFRLGDVRHVFADTARARTELAFSARINLAEGMREFASAELRDSASAVSAARTSPGMRMAR